MLTCVFPYTVLMHVRTSISLCIEHYSSSMMCTCSFLTVPMIPVTNASIEYE